MRLTAAQALLGAGKEVFQNVVGECDNRYDATARRGDRAKSMEDQSVLT